MDRFDALSDRVQVVEGKLDHLSASVDRRFDEVSAAIVEQRRYTEFAYARLDAKIDALDAKLDAKIDALDAKMEARFAQVEERLGRIESRLDGLEARFDRFELKLDRIIEIQDRRLQALEQSRPPSRPM